MRLDCERCGSVVGQLAGNQNSLKHQGGKEAPFPSSRKGRFHPLVLLTSACTLEDRHSHGDRANPPLHLGSCSTPVQELLSIVCPSFWLFHYFFSFYWLIPFSTQHSVTSLILKENSLLSTPNKHCFISLLFLKQNP